MYSRGFVLENPEFKFFSVSNNDGFVKRWSKKLASYLTSSIRFTISHYSNMRTYVSLRSSSNSDTVERVYEMVLSSGQQKDIETIHTENGIMVSQIDIKGFGEVLQGMIQEWVTLHTYPKRNTHRDSGFYKKILRLKILFNHVNSIYSDKYNVYQAAYLHEGFSFRASLCFVMQIVSIVALAREPNDESVNESRVFEDYVLIVVTILYMLFNIPANYATSNTSQGIFMLHVFIGLGMYSRVLFVLMDMIINTILMSFLPVISARLLSATTISTEIVTRSLSVMFITSLDDTAITKGESNRLLESQNSFLKEMVERVDDCNDSDRLGIIKYIPWVENIAILTSVVFSYFIVFS